RKEGHRSFKVLRDWMRTVAASERRAGSQLKEAADSAYVDDRVVAKLNAPGVQDVVKLWICVRIDEQHSLAAFFQVLPDCRRFLRKERLPGSGQHEDVAIRGHIVRGYEVDAF